MPSPFHQKYSSQSHKYFGESVPDESPNQERRGSDSSTESSGSQRRRSSATLFANLEALKRPTDPESTRRRASWQDARVGEPGPFGRWWTTFTRGPMMAEPRKQDKARDTSTLRQ